MHGDSIAALVAEARAGEGAVALGAWRQALALLPAESKQARAIAAEIETLEAEAEAAGAPTTDKPKLPGWLAGLGAAGLFAWKAKVILLFLLTKAKLLLTGFASWPTLLTLVLSFGVYWAAWGWGFAAGLLASLYVHELGHVVALRHYGLPASAPMFVPGVGAFVRLKARPASPAHDARIGLAGPWAGLVAALGFGAAYLASDSDLMLAIARVGGWINLFNLIPVWQLDGGRAFASLPKAQRALAAGAAALAWLLSGEILLGVIALAALARAGMGRAPSEGDRGALAQYAILLGAHAAFASLDV